MMETKQKCKDCGNKGSIQILNNTYNTCIHRDILKLFTGGRVFDLDDTLTKTPKWCPYNAPQDNGDLKITWD